MNIKTNLTNDDYSFLISMAKESFEHNHTSRKLIKFVVSESLIDGEIFGEMICYGVKLDNGSITIDGKFCPPLMVFAFKVVFDSNNVDLVKELLDSKYVIVDNKRYYVGDYSDMVSTTSDRTKFTINLISYDMFKGDEWK